MIKPHKQPFTLLRESLNHFQLLLNELNEVHLLIKKNPILIKNEMNSILDTIDHLVHLQKFFISLWNKKNSELNSIEKKELLCLYENLKMNKDLSELFNEIFLYLKNNKQNSIKSIEAMKIFNRI